MTRDNPVPHLPTTPSDIDRPPQYPRPDPTRRPRQGDQIPSEPRIVKRAWHIAPNEREAENSDLVEQRQQTPLRGHVSARQAGQSLGAGFRRLSGADMQRLEGMARAISDGFRNARDAETRELTSDPEWLRQWI